MGDRAEVRTSGDPWRKAAREGGGGGCQRNGRGMEGGSTAIAPGVLTCTEAPGTDLRLCSTPAGPAPPRHEPWCCPERRGKETSWVAAEL